MIAIFKVRHARGFGFVRLEDGTEPFVPAHLLELSRDVFQPGDRVTVELRTQPDGRVRVTSIYAA